MNCYFIPYNRRSVLSKDIWNVIFCNNNNFWVLYWHIKKISKNVQLIEKKKMSYNLVNKFIYQLVWKGHKKYIKDLNIKYYKIKNVKPWEIIGYMWNSWLNSKWLHTHYSIINMKTFKFINLSDIYDIIQNIKYYK